MFRVGLVLAIIFQVCLTGPIEFRLAENTPENGKYLKDIIYLLLFEFDFCV